MGGTKSKYSVDPPPKSADPPIEKRRLYQVWKGHNKFLCGGRLIFGPDGMKVIATTILIGGPGLAFSFRLLLRTQKVNATYGRAISIGGFVLTALDLAFLFMTSASDPGIIPRKSRPPDLVDWAESSPYMDWVYLDYGKRLPRTREIYSNGRTYKMKFCETCLLYRPPRASHCSLCNNCVLKFDHHCSWVGQCIGARNYRCYFCFVSTSTTLCVYIFSFSLWGLLKQPGDIWTVMSEEAVSITLMTCCFITAWFVGGLTVLHFYLSCTNQTTYERYRLRWLEKTRENPYDRGVIRNLKGRFFHKHRPSLINFRQWVTDEGFNSESAVQKFPCLDYEAIEED